MYDMHTFFTKKGRKREKIFIHAFFLQKLSFFCQGLLKKTLDKLLKKSQSVWCWRLISLVIDVTGGMCLIGERYFCKVDTVWWLLVSFWTVFWNRHYHLQVKANPKKLYKTRMLFSTSMGETGSCHDIFFKFSLRPFEVVEIK